MDDSKRIGILTSGGDCAGLNAVLRAVVHRAAELGWTVLGIEHGTHGLMESPPAARFRHVRRSSASRDFVAFFRHNRARFPRFLLLFFFSSLPASLCGVASVSFFFLLYDYYC